MGILTNDTTNLQVMDSTTPLPMEYLDLQFMDATTPLPMDVADLRVVDALSAVVDVADLQFMDPMDVADLRVVDALSAVVEETSADLPVQVVNALPVQVVNVPTVILQKNHMNVVFRPVYLDLWRCKIQFNIFL
jgi:hypothetical protein